MHLSTLTNLMNIHEFSFVTRQTYNAQVCFGNSGLCTDSDCCVPAVDAATVVKPTPTPPSASACDGDGDAIDVFVLAHTKLVAGLAFFGLVATIVLCIFIGHTLGTRSQGIEGSLSGGGGGFSSGSSAHASGNERAQPFLSAEFDASSVDANENEMSNLSMSPTDAP